MTTNNISSEISVIEVRPYTTTQLANLYGVHRNTVRKWLKLLKDQLGKRTGNYYNVRQVHIIFKNIEPPFQIKQSNDFEELQKEEKKKIKRGDRTYAKLHNVGKLSRGFEGGDF